MPPIRVSNELKDKVRRAAAHAGVTFSDFVRVALEAAAEWELQRKGK
jgi:uncharacterized protein (DUF1778 family)